MDASRTKYREGDKIEVIDKNSEFYGQKGTVLPIGKYENDGSIWIAFRSHKLGGRRFTEDQIILRISAIRGKELEPCGCCVSNLGGVSAYVFLDDCPIKREFDQYDGKCTCVNTHHVWSPPSCEYYKGLKEVVRGGRKVWRVFCDAVKLMEEQADERD